MYETLLKNKPILKIVITSLISLTIINCGYQVLRDADTLYNKQTSKGISISITPILNHTSHPKLDWLVRDTIANELSNWPNITLTKKKNADYVLICEILSYSSQIPYTYDRDQNPLEYKILITMDISFEQTNYTKLDKNLVKPSNNNKMPSITNITEEEIYRIYNNDLGKSKRAEWAARDRAVRRMIKRAIDGLLFSIFRDREGQIE